MIVCWSAKGGSGTTVTACALAIANHAVLVDTVGDVPMTLGLAESSAPALAEWMNSPTSDTTALEQLVVAADHRLRVLPRGVGALPTSQWPRAAAALAALSPSVIVDAGIGPPPEALTAGAAASLLVIRPCYLALRRAVQCAVRPTGVIVVNEPGRALRAADIERTVGAPVVVQIDIDPAVARAVDAGLLMARLPRSLNVASMNLVRSDR